jgi:riboflavin biosynthesis pyrimidine reductase
MAPAPLILAARTPREPAHRMFDFKTPSDLIPFQVLFDDSESNPALPPGLVDFVGNIGFPAPPEHRPWVYSNFVQSLDGMVTFGGKRPEGRWIAQSRHDRWMMDLLRAHADAVLYGAGSLVQETLFSGIAGGPIFRIADPDLLQFRREQLGKARQRNIIVTGSGNLHLSDYRLFRQEAKEMDVDAWIVTTPEGAARMGNCGNIPMLIFGEGGNVDLPSLLQALRHQYGVSYLLCEGGPTLYGNMVRDRLLDEKFVTIAPQEIGPMVVDEEADDPPLQQPTGPRYRLTTIAGVSFSIETARWYRWLSCRKAGNHGFHRYRVSP